MKSSILIIIIVLLQHKAAAQSLGGLEQYYYFGSKQKISVVNIAYYQSAGNWYAEARYNYEEEKTVSLYAGKTFYKEGQFACGITPMIGLLIGNFKGRSAGVNMDFSYDKFALSSQMQYVFARAGKSESFMLSWSELTYQALSFLKSGLALQQTKIYKIESELEAGLFAGFSYKSFSLPVYVFRPTKRERNYVIGITYEWQHRHSKDHSPVPSVRGRGKSGLE